MLEKCLASGFVLRTAATKPEDYDRNIYHDLRNNALLQRTLFAISASLAAWPTVKLILISMMTLGQGILVFVAPVARRSSVRTSEKDTIPFCAAALVLAVIVLGVLFRTAPGVHFTLPL